MSAKPATNDDVGIEGVPIEYEVLQDRKKRRGRWKKSENSV